MIDWKTKLCSRKFWMAVVALVSGILLAVRVPESEVNQISGIILSAAAVLAYAIGEGLADAAGAANAVIVPEYDADDPGVDADAEGKDGL